MKKQDNTAIQLANEKQNTAIEYKRLYNSLLDTRQITDGESAQIIYNTAVQIEKDTKLPISKAVYLIKENEYYKALGYKSFEQWATDINGGNLGKSTAHAYAKVGAFVLDSGTATEFAIIDDDEHIKADVDYSVLAVLIEKLAVKDDKKRLDKVATHKAIADFIEKNALYGVSLANVRKLFDTKDITAESKVTVEQGAKVDEQSAKVDEQVTKVDEQGAKVDPLNVARNSKAYKHFEPIFAKAILELLNANKDDLDSLITAFTKALKG